MRCCATCDDLRVLFADDAAAQAAMKGKLINGVAAEL